jgi:ribose 5-phosphate isomerase B
MKLVLSTDHAGLELLQRLEEFLTQQGHECMNVGPTKFISDDDYPDYIAPAARAVADGEADLGIIMGGSGQGEAMTANRFKGVRCAVYYGPATAVGAIDAEGSASADQYEILRLSRIHNNANMLSLGSRFLTWSQLQEAVTIWLETPFTNVERHARRIAKIDNVAP